MFKKLAIFTAAVASLGLFVVTSPALAVDCAGSADCVNQALTDIGSTGSSKTSVGSIIKTVVNILLFVLGAICVIMIVVGGIRYATSQGDQSGVQAAKNTILYAVIGLIVAIAAYAIVDFTIGQFTT